MEEEEEKKEKDYEVQVTKSDHDSQSFDSALEDENLDDDYFNNDT